MRIEFLPALHQGLGGEWVGEVFLNSLQMRERNEIKKPQQIEDWVSGADTVQVQQ